jgi:RHS repeat-associated protein/uncharacterized repeat protein (TIGR02543 family)
MGRDPSAMKHDSWLRAPGFVFGGWSGACSGTAASVTVTMSGNVSCTATFGHRLTVAARLKSGSPYNDVQWTSSPAGIDCWTNCAATFPSGTVVTLYTSEGPSSWSGDCSLHQSLTMDGDKTCIAIFNNYLGPIRLGAQTFSAVDPAASGATLVPTSMGTPTTLQVVEYYHLDAVGSVRAVTDADGTVIARHDFRPFGEELNPQTPPHDRKLFTGQERDFETGLDYFYARQLRVQTGRFTTPDPVADLAWTDPTRGATNPYAYVNNNPLRYVDPTGMTSGLVHLNCTGVESCAQMMSNWASANNGWCTPADGGGLDCGVGYIVQVSPSAAPVNSSVSQPLTPMGAGVLSFYPGRGPSAGTGVGGGGGGNGANSGTPWYKNPCVQHALLKGAATVGLDAVGLIPEGGTIAAAFSAWSEVQGLSNGAKGLQQAQLAAAIISTGAAAGELSQTTDMNASSVVAGLQASVGALGVAKGLIEDIPAIGQAIAGASVVLDLIGTGMGVAGCYGW